MLEGAVVSDTETPRLAARRFAATELADGGADRLVSMGVLVTFFFDLVLRTSSAANLCARRCKASAESSQWGRGAP